MKHHRKTVGKYNQKKNGMRKTMKGGVWPFTSSTPATTSASTTPATTPVATTPAKPFSFSEYLFSFLPSSSKTAETSSSPVQNTNTNTTIGGYMGGKRRGKSAKKPCAKKGGGK